MAGCVAVGPGCGEVGGANVHIKNHAGRMASYLCVKVACHEVKEGVDLLHCFDGWLACWPVILLRAMRMVRSTARP